MPQEELPPAIKDAAMKELDSKERTTRVMAMLEDCINFLARLGGGRVGGVGGNMPLRDYVLDVLLLDAAVCSHTCSDMCIYMCTDMYIYMCTDMYIYMCTDMCTDMHIYTFFDMAGSCGDPCCKVSKDLEVQVVKTWKFCPRWWFLFCSLTEATTCFAI